MSILASLGRDNVSGGQLLDYRQMLDRDISQAS